MMYAWEAAFDISSAEHWKLTLKPVKVLGSRFKIGGGWQDVVSNVSKINH